MKRVLLICAFLVPMLVFSTSVFAIEQTNVTNLGFAEFLQTHLNINIPAENKNLPKDQYFNTLSNALSGVGINNFQNTPFDMEVDFGKLSEVLFTLVKGTGNLDTNGKIDYLMKNGYLTEKIAPETKVTMADLQKIFANPQLSGLIAQTYIAPTPARNGEPGADAPGTTPELPASQI